MKGVAAFLSNHLNKCAPAFREALTKQTEVILVCNCLDLFNPEIFGSGTTLAFLSSDVFYFIF